jgi:hypothetical protein
MSDLLAIFGPAETDAELLCEIAKARPGRVTILIEDVDSQLAGEPLRERLAVLMASIESRTGATVVGLAGDRAQLLGWRFDRELTSRVAVPA